MKKKARAIRVITAKDLAPKIKAAPIKLNLACGDRAIEGCINVDVVKTPSVDRVVNLTKFPWPWKSGSVSEVRSHHFFEHLTPKERISFLEECYRILEDDGTVEIVSPYFSSARAIQDPTHVWPPLAEASFFYFSKRWLEVNRLLHAHPYKCNFEFVAGHGVNPSFAQKEASVRQFAEAHYVNAVDDLYIKLIKCPDLKPATDTEAQRLVSKLQGK